MDSQLIDRDLRNCKPLPCSGQKEKKLRGPFRLSRVADYFQASEAHRYALMNELMFIKSSGERFRASIELVRALGGSWKHREKEKNAGIEKAVELFEGSAQ
mgnify:FL=1